MHSQAESPFERRPLTHAERELARWMLEHGSPDAATFLLQLDRAAVVGRCSCGCASFDVEIDGLPASSGPLQILGDYVFGDEATLAGAFIFACGGVLAGIEVYGWAGDAPKDLPSPHMLRSFSEEGEREAGR